jgi:hypothetical protein
MLHFQLKNIFLKQFSIDFKKEVPFEAVRLSSCVNILTVPSLHAITISLFGKQMQFHKD